MNDLEARTDRARIHESCRYIYDLMYNSRDQSKSIFLTLKDVFMFAASFGYKRGKRVELPSGKKDGLRMEVFSENDRDIMKCIALVDSSDLNVLDRKAHELVSPIVLTIVEEYAHGGIEEMRVAILERSGDPLTNIIDLVINS